MRQKLNYRLVQLCTAILFIFISTSLFAQKKVNGTVLSAKDNQPVNGATILVKGSNVGTATTTDGTFTINVPSGRNTLRGCLKFILFVI